MPFKSKKALILGATSGIGKALALKLANEGIAVIAVGRRKENLDELAKHHNIGTIVFDITELHNIPKFAQGVASMNPDLDSVVFNAGLQRPLNWLNPETVDLNNVELEFKTNYLAHLHLTKAFLPFFQQKAPQSASLIYVTSGLALVPVVSTPNYCASKAALHHMILAMRLQLKEHSPHIKIIEILPPAVKTELHGDRDQSMGMDLDDFTEETYAGLIADDNEHIPVQLVKTMLGYNGWEQERQKKMKQIFETMRERN